MNRCLKSGYVYLVIAGAVALFGLPSAVQAQPVIDLAWNGCLGTGGVVAAPAQNLDWTDRFAQYRLYSSASNVSAPVGESIFGHDVSIQVGVNLPDAWRFDPDGCQTAQFAQINYNDLGVGGCPGLRSGASVVVTGFIWADPVAGKAVISAATGYPDGRASAAIDIGTTYLLWEITFPMTSADITGGTQPCLGADLPVCFVYTRQQLVIGPDVVNTRLENMTSGTQPWVTFNDASNTQNCPVVQVNESTWGQVKNLYR
jgi:hypothetical protein